MVFFFLYEWRDFIEWLEDLQIFFFFLLKSRNYSVRRIYYKNSYLRKNLLDFKYLLILLKSLDCLLFVLKLFFSCRCWKIHQYFIWHKKKNPLCNPPNPFSKLRDLNGSMPSVPLHFGSSDLTSVSYRTVWACSWNSGIMTEISCSLF